MPIIQLKTHINADPQTCFDVSRSIDVHANSMADAKEKAIAGRTSGHIGLHETVTWHAITVFNQLKLYAVNHAAIVQAWTSTPCRSLA